MICIFVMVGMGLVSRDASRRAYLMSNVFLYTTCRYFDPVWFFENIYFKILK